MFQISVWRQVTGREDCTEDTEKMSTWNSVLYQATLEALQLRIKDVTEWDPMRPSQNRRPPMSSAFLLSVENL